MKTIKKIILTALTVCCLFCFISKSEAAEKMQIITTIFPEYDWVQNILGENPANVEVIQLLNNGVDLHSYQPTADDIMKLSECDLFIYVGGESDEWVEDALNEAVNRNIVIMDLLDALGDSVKEEELVEGMETDHDHEHEDHEDEHEDHDHEHEDEEIEYDEQILTLNSMQSLTSGDFAEGITYLSVMKENLNILKEALK